MSRIAQLQGKPKKIKVGDVELDLKPLTMKDLDLVSGEDNSSTEKQMELMKKLVSKVLKTSYPDTTDEEIDNISLEHLTELQTAIMKLHNLDKIIDIKDVIAKRQTGQDKKGG